jgi:hypothetical protein
VFKAQGAADGNDILPRFHTIGVAENGFSHPNGATLAERLVAVVAGETGVPVTA